MVQTRSASGVDVPPTPTPARTTRASSAAAAAASARKPSARSRKSTTPATPSPLSQASEAETGVVRRAPAPRGAGPSGAFAYTPDVLTLVWLAVSVPVVFWDLGYVLLRPYTLPGGPLGWLYGPYTLYGEVDHVYSTQAWRDGEGFGAAQSALNLLENLLYLAFFQQWARHGVPALGGGGGAAIQKTVAGRPAARAAVLLLAAAVMTESKTILYWLNEYYSHFGNIGHNDLNTLIFLWILPNGLWLIFPAYVAYKAASAIVDGLAGSATVVKEE